MDPLLSLLLLIIIVGFVCWLLTLIVAKIPMEAPFAQIARATILIVGLVIILRAIWPFLNGLL